MCEVDYRNKYDELNENIKFKLGISMSTTIDFLEKRKFIFYFAVIWSIFENICCNCYTKIANVYPSDKISNFDTNILKETWKYFHTRYVTHGKTNDLFDQIWKKTTQNSEKGNEDPPPISEKEKKQTAAILEKPTPDDNEKVKALICIVFRLRNRLFHGEKTLPGITSQEDSFVVASEFLIECIRQKVKIIHKKSPAS